MLKINSTCYYYIKLITIILQTPIAYRTRQSINLDPKTSLLKVTFIHITQSTNQSTKQVQFYSLHHFRLFGKRYQRYLVGFFRIAKAQVFAQSTCPQRHPCSFEIRDISSQIFWFTKLSSKFNIVNFPSIPSIQPLIPNSIHTFKVKIVSFDC